VYVKRNIEAAGIGLTPTYYALSFDNKQSPSIFCAPSQQFFRSSDQQWIPAHQIVVGDQLQTRNYNHVYVTAINFIQRPLKVYILQIQEPHTFLVGAHALVTHNFAIPELIKLGIGITFDTGCGSGLGLAFDPVYFIGELVLSTLAGLLINRCFNKDDVIINDDTSNATKSLPLHLAENQTKEEVNSHKEDGKNTPKSSYTAQEPGIPTEEDGFVPKKNWEGEKVKHRRGYGWPDKKGSIWIPTGPQGHGGPHWYVQHKDGSYDNVVPGGQIRGQK
ncbi:MAG: hypothetical protein WBQ73_02145, partial [Candidatus Babeliales bacterium]